MMFLGGKAIEQNRTEKQDAKPRRKRFNIFKHLAAAGIPISTVTLLPDGATKIAIGKHAGSDQENPWHK